MKPRLQDLLDNPGQASEIPVDSIPGMLAQLGGLQVILSARLIDSEGHASGNGNPEDRLLGVTEAAEKMGVTKNWFYRRTGKLPFMIRLGRQVRYSEKGIERFIRQRTGR